MTASAAHRGGAVRARPASQVGLKRTYDPVGEDDGARILVDRLWPRGIRKQALALTQWARELAPSTELRQWYGHDPARWDEFRQRYAAELRAQPEALAALQALARAGRITLLYSARETERNNAVALREFLLHPATLERGR